MMRAHNTRTWQSVMSLGIVTELFVEGPDDELEQAR